MVVNRRVDKTQDVALRFDLTAKPVDKVERFDKQRGAWVELVLFDANKLDERPGWEGATDDFSRRGRRAVELIIAAGDGALLRLSVKKGE